MGSPLEPAISRDSCNSIPTKPIMFTCQNKIHPIRGVRRVENRCDVFFLDINLPPCLKACPASTPLPMGELKHGPHQSHPSYFIYTAMKVPARAELAGLSLTYSITKGTSCSILPHDQPSAPGRAKEGSSTIMLVPARDYGSYEFILDSLWLWGE